MRNALSNQPTQGNDTYPKTIENSVRLLKNYKTVRIKQVAMSQYKEEEEEVVSLEHGIRSQAEECLSLSGQLHTGLAS